MNKIITDQNHLLSAVVMAKAAVPGRVKTRLTRGEQGLSDTQASEVHSAMFAAVLNRVAAYVRTPDGGPPALVLAMDDPAGAPAEAPAAGWRVVTQGGGDLGERLDRVWRDCQAHTRSDAVVFFGVDSPDVPAEVLGGIGEALIHAPAAIGPAADGGYWTLACREYMPALLRGIDWGTPAVYDQTLEIAQEAGLDLRPLPGWHDVDDLADLRTLAQRLQNATEPALQQLLDRLHPIAATLNRTRP